MKTESLKHLKWVWRNMMKRCYDSKNHYYHVYGGKGVKVEKRWHSFDQFFKDMGFPPPDYTLDRKDSNGDYGKNNCRWATQKEQQRNRTNNVNVTINGETYCLAEWAERRGIPYKTVHSRTRLGWSIEEALGFKPSPGYKRHHVTHNGRTLTLYAWARELGINYGTAHSRILYAGWTPHEALGFSPRKE